MYYNAFETKENKIKTKDAIELQRIIALLQAVAKIPTRQSYKVLNWLHTIRTYLVTFFMTFSSLKVCFKKDFPIGKFSRTTQLICLQRCYSLAVNRI